MRAAGKRPARPVAADLSGPALRVTLPYGVLLEVYARQGVAATVFPDGRAALARDEGTQAILDTAGRLGYPATRAGAWEALVERAAMHSLVSAWRFGQPSPALLAAAGEPQPPGVVEFERGLVLAFQHWYRTGQVTLPLQGWSGRDLQSYRLELVRLLPRVPARGELTRPAAVH